MSQKQQSLRHMTLSELIDEFETKRLTAEHLLETYISRISEVNNEFNAIIELSPDALDDARILDAERNHYKPRGQLHGVPILLKDNIATVDRTNSTCGSFALVGARPSNEAAVVTGLRRAGAIILGKGNMAEWSGFRSTIGCSGWSARGGQCQGIFYPGMKPSGSSSGCAVAVALGLCFAAVGSEVYHPSTQPHDISHKTRRPATQLFPLPRNLAS